MIIVEGPDGGGKSTLVKMLTEGVPWSIDIGGGPAKSKEEIESRIIRFIHRGPYWIYDRFPIISECIYGPIFGRPPHITPTHLAMLASLNALIIYCRPTKFNLDQQDKEIDTPDYVAKLRATLPLVVTAYDFFFDVHTRGVVKYDHTNLSEVLAKVRQHVKETTRS